MKTKIKFTLVETLIVLAFIGLLTWFPILYASLGIFPFGETKVDVVTVQRLYVDVSGSKDSTKSHYMVGTDKGVFEVNNSLWNWIWNADEIYSSLEVGKKYHVKARGRKLVNFFFQSYPSITYAFPDDKTTTQQ